MRLSELLQQIDENQRQIDAHGKLDPEILKKIHYKFRLDWNYYSNRMEGGTLTREETRSVMVGNIDVKGKPLKDIMEMNGHDQTVLDILKLGKGEQRISEKRIKELHKAIMYEEDAIEARQIGEWKQIENHVINYKKEKIEFASPADVPEKIHDLLNRTNAALDQRPKLHPLVIAAHFHIDFVTIHPFYDGNGRTARILTNILLISNGFPPIVIKDQHKEAYYRLLADVQAYGGSPDLFYAYIGERLIESQELVLSAIRGEEVEEEDDIDKEITLWKQSISSGKTVGTIKKNDSLVAKLYLQNLKLLFDSIKSKHDLFDDLFSENSYKLLLNNSSQTDRDLFDVQIRQIIEGKNDTIDEIGLLINHKAYKKDGLNIFDVYHRITLKFDDYQFHIGDNYMNQYKFTYSQPPNASSIRSMASDMVKSHFAQIKSKLSTK